jgi:hypothetical protein
MQNHAFFYALGRRSDFDAFGRLEGRVPELFSALSSQVNSALRIVHRNRSYSPPTVVLHHRNDKESFVPVFFKFYLNRHSCEDSAARMQNAGAPDIMTFRFAKLVYIPLNETATSDRHFMHLISTMIERSYFDPSSCLILRLPYGQAKDTAISARLHKLASGLQGAPRQIPRVVADNVFVASEDIDLNLARQQATELGLLLHDTFDFWRWAPDSYKAFDRIGIFVQPGRHQAAPLSSLLKVAYGSKAHIVRHHWAG